MKRKNVKYSLSTRIVPPPTRRRPQSCCLGTSAQRRRRRSASRWKTADYKKTIFFSKLALSNDVGNVQVYTHETKNADWLTASVLSLHPAYQRVVVAAAAALRSERERCSTGRSY